MGRGNRRKARWLIAAGVMLLSPAASAAGQPAASPQAASPLAELTWTGRGGDIERSRLREAALEVLVEAAQDRDPQIRANATEALEDAPARLSPLLPALLADTNEGVRGVAAMVVGRGGHCEHRGRVRRLLRDNSPYVRAAAIFALRTCGEKIDPTPLATLLMDHPSDRVRAHAAFVLGEIGDPSALPMLRDAAARFGGSTAAGEEGLLRLQLTEAMIKLGDESRREAIRAALYPDTPEALELVALAVQIIGETGDRVAIPQLVYLSAYTDGERLMPAEVRLAIAASLAKLGRTEGWFIADEFANDPTPAIRAQAAFVYGRTARDEDIRSLIRMSSDPSALVRVSAASAILNAVAAERRP